MVPGDFAVFADQVLQLFWYLLKRSVALCAGLELHDLIRILPRPHVAYLLVVSEVAD
ncbi:hypothetical protein O999_15470 [Pseudomonas putida LF54]|nr:hypothetical protein O999_15470 [Pseudomonas putida LF54]